MSEATITLDSREEAILLFGSRDQYLQEIRDALGVQQLVGRGDRSSSRAATSSSTMAERVFGQLRQMLRQQGSLSAEDVQTVLEVVTQGGERIGPPADRSRRTAAAATSGRAPTARPATSTPCATTT